MGVLLDDDVVVATFNVAVPKHDVPRCEDAHAVGILRARVTDGLLGQSDIQSAHGHPTAVYDDEVVHGRVAQSEPRNGYASAVLHLDKAIARHMGRKAADVPEA
mmetsp:Transcript_22140/g.44579  ORF Transcript_22140/g.44579 Transcript_22140/m.44579 type:complete len:104 (-) Transcript_22140:46-357(-)